MNSKQPYIILLFFILTITVAAQEKLAPVYNLNLNLMQDSLLVTMPWGGDVDAIYIDSTEMREGNYTFYLGSVKAPILFLPIYHCLHAKITHPFFLGKNSFQQMEIKLEYKTKEIDNAYLLLSTVDDTEQVKVDTFYLEESEDWKTYHCQIPLKNNVYAFLSIAAKGKGAFLQKDKGNQRLYIQNLSVSIDQKDIKDTPIEKNYPYTELDTTQFFTFTPDTLKELAAHIAKMHPKRILGIGETIHGSKSLNKLELDLLYELATQHGYHNILLELHNDLTFYWNLFITNENYNYTYEKFEKIFSNFAFTDPIRFYSFLCDLKEINKNRDEKNKIRLYGIDVPGIGRSLFQTLLDSMVNQRQNKVGFEILRSVLHPQEPSIEEYGKLSKSERKELIDSLKITYPKLLKACIKTPALKELLLDKNYFALLQSLHSLPDPEKGTNGLLEAREIFLWENTKAYLEEYPKEKFLLFGHLDHVTKTYSSLYCFQSFTLGSGIIKQYPDDYVVIGLLLGNGEVNIFNINGTKKGIFSLQNPPNNSLENKSLHTNKNYFYSPISSTKPNHLYLLRTIGNGYSQDLEFSIYRFPQYMMDAYIFMKE